MLFSRNARTALATTLLLLLPTAACAGHESAGSNGSADSGDSIALRQAPQRAAAGRATNPTHYVLAISVDGLNAEALDTLGKAGTPNFHRMMENGAATSNARTEFERTLTLPNHTGMITGRRVSRSSGGHGVDFNDDNHRTVQQAAGHPVASVFSVFHNHDLSTALFASKQKFAIFKRSWPGAVDRFTVNLDNRELVRSVRADLVAHPRAFTFLHLSRPDDVGHAKGFMSPAYMQAVKATDQRLGELIHTVNTHPKLLEHLTVVLTADHGGEGPNGHSDIRSFANYRVPFVVWGAGVKRGARLYDLNRAFATPGFARPTYAAAKQPIRNADVANLSTSLVDLGPVPGSELNFDQALLTR
ncbi:MULTISPECIES: alkaline phosphatase family protein [unclassified Nocardioides]|uniref:alkaline phosphatase family protein n=1 Tax=unclassified Nocardioides TaxID=2615069 RepID=UPI0006F9D382|nr:MULTISPECIES: alkaline phosphatase family protein [unclassified Nocardioides]KQY63558.1 hypothetical protein ASD30_00645 [Nocardioides sp. Root140]KRF17491.1 hypothetical protein ASH02_24795 [Nocardioides sp. Soil796]